jgi:hypothetical protein
MRAKAPRNNGTHSGRQGRGGPSSNGCSVPQTRVGRNAIRGAGSPGLPHPRVPAGRYP